MKFKLDELADLLLNNQIGKPLHCFPPDRKIYFIKIENDFERECIFRFWKSVGIEIKEVCDDNHQNRSLIDIWIHSDKSMIVSYELWHILQSNATRVAGSHSYNEFKELLKQNSTYYNELISIEQNYK